MIYSSSHLYYSGLYIYLIYPPYKSDQNTQITSGYHQSFQHFQVVLEKPRFCCFYWLLHGSLTAKNILNCLWEHQRYYCEAIWRNQDITENRNNTDWNINWAIPVLTWLVGCVGRWSNELVLLPLMESILDWPSTSSLTENAGQICKIQKTPKNLQLFFFNSGHPLFWGRSYLSEPYNFLLPDSVFCFMNMTSWNLN